MATDQDTDTFDFTEQLHASQNPKISIHERGQVHVEAQGTRIDPLFIPPLRTFRGQHLATIRCDSVEPLPVSSSRLTIRGATVDLAIGVPDGVRAARLLLYANGEQPSFMVDKIHRAFEVQASDGCSMYFGLTGIADSVLGARGEQGVTGLAGFDPTAGRSAAEYLYVRGI